MPDKIIRDYKRKNFWRLVDKLELSEKTFQDITGIEKSNQRNYRTGKINMADKKIIHHSHQLGIAVIDSLYVPPDIFKQIDEEHRTKNKLSDG